MAKPSPKDMQLYVLATLALAAVVVGGKTVMDSMAKPSAPATTTGTAGTTAPGTPPIAGIVAAPDPATSPAADGSYVLGRRNRFPSGGRDPFTLPPEERLTQASEPIKELAPPVPRTVTGGEIQRALQGIQRGKILDNELNKIAGTAPLPLPPPKPEVRVLKPSPPPYTVSGVVIGEPGGRDVAILKRDGTTDEKKFVVVGDPLEGGFTVTAIESGGVVVRHPGRPTITTAVPGSVPITTGEEGVTYQLKQTIIVPATTAIIPLTAASPAAPNPARAK